MMYVIRDVFRCKPGKSRQVAELFKAALPGFEKAKILTHGRILLDAVTDYWTVILEAEVENLGEYERQMEEYGKRDELRKTMIGYVDLVEGGRREIYRIV